MKGDTYGYFWDWVREKQLDKKKKKKKKKKKRNSAAAIYMY